MNFGVLCKIEANDITSITETSGSEIVKVTVSTFVFQKTGQNYSKCKIATLRKKNTHTKRKKSRSNQMSSQLQLLPDTNTPTFMAKNSFVLQILSFTKPKRC